MLSTSEENFPTVLPVLLELVRGPERLPADEELQEMLRGKLRILQADSDEVKAVFMELSVHLISISSEENAVFVTFRTFEELWKFSTYYTAGFLSHCLENLLLDQKFWLMSLEEDVAIEVRFSWFYADELSVLSLPASGTCLATKEYDAEGPDELSLAPGDRIIIVGHLVSCFDWFTGRKESTGDVGLVKTSLAGPSSDVYSNASSAVSSPAGSSSSRVGGPQPDPSRGAQRTLGQNTVVAVNRTPEIPPEEPKTPDLPCFRVHPVVEGNITENFTTLFSFLEGANYRSEFGVLYRLSSRLLASSVFTGHADEDELISFLSVARETARKKRLFWSQTRLCFLLGKLCAGRLKFSQARVYLEETLSVPRESFVDLKLLASILSNLVGIYLLQKNTESLFATAERLTGLLFGISDCLESLEDDIALKYILKKAILSRNKMAEARACHLLTRFHWSRAEGDQVVPYLERLLVLCAEDELAPILSTSHGYLTLGRLYGELQLLQLSVSSAWKASQQSSVTLRDCLSCMTLVLDNVTRLRSEREDAIPAQLAPYLHRALSFSRDHPGQHQVLSYHLTMCLCRLFCKYGMVEQAICQMHHLINSSDLSQHLSVSDADRNSALIWLAWLHLDRHQPEAALDILDAVLATMPEHCVVLNMRGVALGCMGDLRKAAESYQAAAEICEEYEDMPNWAVAQANRGLLCVKAGANGLAQRYLTDAVKLFSELDEIGHEENFITVLLQLGQNYVRQQQLDTGKGCYEWALLLSISAGLLECQLIATRHLCQLYELECPDQAQCIKYNQHQIRLLGTMRAQRQEAEALESLSQRFLSLGAERAYRAALDYTKSSLGIFIDLGCKEKEASGWLQAGRIYHLLGQTELVDLYVQAAQDVALSTGDTKFILKILEAAGDIFFNSCQDRHKAIPFYRDRALPISGRSSSVGTRLRLCNKLTELMLRLKLYEEAVEFAQTALDISVSLGEHLSERVAYHRLAVLYHCLDQYELAEHYYLKTLSLCPTPLLFEEETLYYVQVYQTLGDITFYDLKDPYDAAGYYHLALAAAMDLGNKRSQMQLCTRLATIYHNFLVDRELSLFFYQKARRFAAELNVRRVNISADQYYCRKGY
uniref:SH3 domain and tetratricopeptide repeats 1 n=1 Tax=Takifugu rubripes TaxID=31033 RepID=H2RS50_TAKRU